MTMRDQILTGIRNVVNDPDSNSLLSGLGYNEINSLADSVLSSLSEVPEDTPEPQVTVTPAATPMLVLSPADVVARYAMDARSDVRESDEYRSTPEDLIVVENLAAGGEDRIEFREFMFRIQTMFGVRVRTPREAGSGYLVAGAREQIRAFQRVCMTIRPAADATIADLDSADRKVFWATLGTLIADHEDADDLIESNRGLFMAATGHLNREYGRVRNLRRATPATEGDVYDAAAEIAPVRLPYEPGTLRPVR